MNITEYSNDDALRKAAERLRKTNDPVSDILADLGFSDRTYFYRQFEAKYQMSPVQYRKNAR